MFCYRAQKKLLEPNGGNSFKRSVKPCLLSGLLSGSSLSSLFSNNSSAVNNSSYGVNNLFSYNSGGVNSLLSGLLGGVVGAGNHGAGNQANASDNGKSQN